MARCRANQAARYHGDAVSVVPFPDWKTAPLGFVETCRELSGTQFASAGLREKQRDISGAVPPLSRSSPSRKRLDHWKGGGFIRAVASWEVRCYAPFSKCWKKGRICFDPWLQQRLLTA
ncbi:hypothetical protein ILYODFUR_031277 [Ilyodon furcidens]|uniref:Uncharacterized protein n=1 Tax=Ilyodon furcidens TaxID=33524 RepID=A0ABV0TSF7_9TELE